MEKKKLSRTRSRKRSKHMDRKPVIPKAIFMATVSPPSRISCSLLDHLLA